MNTQVQFLGHAAFKVITPEGRVVIVDPWLLDNPFIPHNFKVQPQIDLMLITHGHEDHMDIRVQEIISSTHPLIVANNICRWFLMQKGVPPQRFEPMNVGGTIHVLDLSITMVNAVHRSHVYESPDTISHPHEAVGFVIKTSDNVTIYFAGDTALFGDMKLIADLYQPDVAALPIGNRSMMGAKEAVYAARLLNVKHVIPFHYGTVEGFAKSPDEFLEMMSHQNYTKVHALKPGAILTKSDLH